jgi:BirA family biotin operon repressor/biotin-[acetyl-CoA-carboxylase] ligase
MQVLEKIFSILADGHFHSGQAISEELSISRSSVWNAIEKLKAMGLDIFAVKGHGYRLADPIEPLDKKQILSHMQEPQRTLIPHLDMH